MEIVEIVDTFIFRDGPALPQNLSRYLHTLALGNLGIQHYQ